MASLLRIAGDTTSQWLRSQLWKHGMEPESQWAGCGTRMTDAVVQAEIRAKNT